MRKLRINGKSVTDLMLFERDSYSLHLFSLVIIRSGHYIIKTPDIRIPMPVKPMKLRLPRVLREAEDILKKLRKDK